MLAPISVIAAFVFSVAAGILMYREFRLMIQEMGLRRSWGEHNGETAKEHFMELLDMAKHKMIVYDDGDFMDDGLYSDRGLIEAVKEKLATVPDFRIECFIDDDRPLPFRDELAGHPRVAIRTGNGDADWDTRCEIIDDGRMGYLSGRGDGYFDRERYFELVDCRIIPDKSFPAVAKRMLGPHIDNFNRKFAAAAA